MPSLRMLILGANGGLGRALVRRLAGNHSVTAWTRADLDFEQPEKAVAKLDGQDFDVLLNAAGMTSPDACETQPEKAALANVAGPQAVAEACRRRGARMIHFSTDYVFSGESQQVWSEEDETRPVSVYGRTKRDGELAVIEACPDALIARVSWLFGPDKASHPDQMIERALQTDDLSAVADKTSTPTSTEDVSEWTCQLIELAASGILHVCNSGIASWHAWAEAALEIAQNMGVPVKTTRVRPIKLSELTQLKARRPLTTRMNNQRLQSLLGTEVRDWRVALEAYLRRKYLEA